MDINSVSLGVVLFGVLTYLTNRLVKGFDENIKALWARTHELAGVLNTILIDLAVLKRERKTRDDPTDDA